MLILERATFSVGLWPDSHASPVECLKFIQHSVHAPSSLMLSMSFKSLAKYPQIGQEEDILSAVVLSIILFL